MSYQINLETTEPIPTAVIRAQVAAAELPKFVPAACGEVWNFARATNLPRLGRHTSLYLPEGWVEVGAEVSKPFTGNDHVVFSQLPGGRVATTTHFGPYQRLCDAHAAIREWCDAKGHKRSGVCWEIYGHWDESWNTAPEKIRTDVFYLLVD
jgi:effector-binding domain-containing protein